MQRKMFFLILLWLGLLSMVSNTFANDMKNCLNHLAQAPQKTLSCLEQHDTDDAKALQAYLYYFDLVNTKSKQIDNHAHAKALMQQVIQHQDEQSNFVYSGMNYDDIYKSSSNFLRALSLLGIDLPFSSVKYHGDELLQAYTGYFYSSRDNFNGRIYGAEALLKQLPEVQQYYSAVAKIDGVSDQPVGANHILDGCGTFCYGKLASITAYQLKPLIPPTVSTDTELVTFPYLQFWSYWGMWNQEKYQSLQRQKQIAARELAAYYVREFGVEQDAAFIAAQNQLTKYTMAVISSYRDTFDVLATHPIFVGVLSNKPLSHLIQLKESPAPEGNTWMLWATSLNAAIIHGRDLETIAWLLQQTKTIAKDNHYAETLIDAPLLVAGKQPNIVKLLIEKGEELNQRNYIGKTASPRS